MTTSMDVTTDSIPNNARATSNAGSVSELIAMILTQLQAHTGRDFSHYQSDSAAPATYGLDFWQAIADALTAIVPYRAHEAQLQFQADVLQQISEVVVAVDPDERITYVNAAAAAQYEVDPVAVVGQPLRHLYRYEWLRPEDALVADAALATQGYWRGENRHIKRDGTVLYVESTFSLLRDGAGQERGVLALVRDVTSRKQAEAALQGSEARYRQLADAMPQLVWTANEAGVVDYYNIRIHDYDPAVWQGAYGFDWEALLHPDDRVATGAAWRRASTRKEGYSFEHRLLMADGSWRWHLSRAILVRSSLHGMRWYGTATDIHEQKQAEAELRQSEARYRHLFESMDEGFCIFEMLFDEAMQPLDYRFLEVNPAFATFTGLVDAVGKTARELVPNLEAHWFEIYGHVALTGETRRFIEGSAAMGRWFEVYAFRFGVPENHRVALLFTDITARKLAEDALRDSEAFSRAILDSSPDCIKVLDAEGRLLQMNTLGLCLMEIENFAPMVGQAWDQLWPAECRSLIHTALTAARTGEHGRFQGLCPTAKGTPKWWDVIVAPVQNSLATTTHFIAVSRDITEAKRTEEALSIHDAAARRHLDELEAIYKTAPVGLCVMDRELRYVRINERLAAMNGYPAAYHLGRTGQELFPDLAEKTDTMLRHILATGEAVIGIELTGEVPTQPGVQRTWIESWLPLHNETGEVSAINIVIEEITEQKHAERALRTSAERLRLATEAGGIGIFDHDLRTNQTEITEIYARITGLPKDVTITREAWMALVHPEDRSLVNAIWTQSQATGISYSYECRIVRPDGVLLWIEVNAWMTLDEQGQAVRITGAIRDITERKQAALHQQFLLDLNETLRKLSDPMAIQQTVVKRLGEYLGVTHCRFNAIDLAADRAVLLAAWSASGSTAGSDVNPLSSYASPAYIADAQAGRTLVVHNAVLDDRQVNAQRLLLEKQMMGMIRVPCLSEGQWVASLHVLQDTQRAWRADEVQLVESVVHHFWPLVEKARAEEALLASERRFRQLADTMPQVVWTSQADGTITYINQQWTTYSGMTLPETLTKGMWPALHAADLANNRAQWQRALERGEPYEGEVRMRRQDGIYRWFLERALPVRDDTGEVQQWFGVSMDITDRKAVEETVAAHAAELRLITDNLLGFISYVDREQSYRFVNAAYEELHGRPREQIVGHSLHSLLGDDVYAQVQPYIERALHGETLQFEATLAYTTGTRTIWATYVPDVDPQGVVQGFYALVTDISERKAFEEALRQSEETARQRLAELEAIYDTAPIGLCVLDRELRWVRINERLAEINGFPAVDHIGRTLHDLLPALAPAAEPILNGILESNQPILNVELHGETPAQPGVERIWLEHWFPLHDHTGLVIGINVVAEEITERKRQEQQLKELNTTLEERVRERTAALEQANQELARSNRELEQFNYAAAHDLKSPLRGIQHLVHWISEDAAALLTPASQKHLTLLQGRVQRLETLLDDMLAYSRIGQVRYTAELVDTNLLVHNIIDLLAPPLGFTITIPVPLPTLLTMRAPLETVLRNLLSNTIKHHHHPADGYVEVMADDRDTWVEFTIRDNGPGIDPAFHERIFGMFQTLRPRDQVEGSGIGLALVKKALESYGGQISVESPTGSGTIFRFTWPKAAS